MAETEENVIIPPELDANGEPLPPPKPRRPHVKGITFRDFDVSYNFSPFRRPLAIQMLHKH